MDKDIYEDLNSKLSLILRNNLTKGKGTQAVLSSVCLGLSQVCEGLVKSEDKRIKDIEKKLSLFKQGKIRLNKKTRKQLKMDLRSQKEVYKKYSKKFLGYALCFTNMSKLFEEEVIK